jgi:hypothetical protein
LGAATAQKTQNYDETDMWRSLALMEMKAGEVHSLTAIAMVGRKTMVRTDRLFMIKVFGKRKPKIADAWHETKKGWGAGRKQPLQSRRFLSLSEKAAETCSS